MNNLQAAVTPRKDGCILIGQTVTCDGFAPERSIRIQTNINRLNDFSTSKGQQKKIVLSQESYEELLNNSPDIKFRREQFEVLPADGSCHTVENIQIRLFPSGYMPGSVIPVVRTENGINVMYLSDFSWSSNLSEFPFPNIDVLVVDVKSDNFDFNSPDLNRVIPLIQAVKPAFVITYSSQDEDENAHLLAKYIENNLGINASFEEQPVGPAWGGTLRTATSNYDETGTTSVNSTSLKRLIVIAPSENQNAETWDPLVQELKKETELTKSEWLLWSWHNLLERGICLSTELKAKIDAQWQSKGPFEEVILIGHGLGGIIIRQAYLLASGTSSRPGYDQSPWYKYVGRFVLFASLNRGFKPAQYRIWQMAIIFEKLTSFSLQRFMPLRDFVQGSAFITNLKIEWIRHFDQPYYPLTIVQLLEAKYHNDSVDLEQLPNAYHVHVPHADHTNIHLIDGVKDREERYGLIREAIIGIRSHHNSESESSSAKSNVVFILHGVRASNSGWVQQLKEKIHQEYPDTEIITPSYGYFSAFNFVLPGLRQSNITWFRNQYSYYFAKYPSIDFHFIGHSNGTYILGESLKESPGIKFKRVYLAGSVLPREYCWRHIFDNNQIEKLCNARSSLDWPVGILCNGLRGVGMLDIGTGGFDGFFIGDDRLEEVYYFDGDHGKPLEKSYHSSIIQFILNARINKPNDLKSEDEISKTIWFKRLRFFSRLAPFAAKGIGAIFAFLIICNLICIIRDFSLGKLGINLFIYVVIFIVIRIILSVI